MSDLAGQRPLLAPAGEPAVDQRGVAPERDVRSHAQPFGDAGPESLEEHVGAVGEREDDVDAVPVLEVDGDAPTAPAEVVGAGEHGGERIRGRRVYGRAAVDADDVGAQVGEQHGGEGHRADGGEFQHAGSGERSALVFGQSDHSSFDSYMQHVSVRV